MTLIDLKVFAVWRAKMRGTFNILLRSLLSSVVLKKSLRLYLPDAHQDQVSTNLNSELEQLMSSMERYHRLAFAPVEICMGLFTFYYYDGVIALLMLPPLFSKFGWNSTNWTTYLTCLPLSQLPLLLAALSDISE